MLAAQLDEAIHGDELSEGAREALHKLSRMILAAWKGGAAQRFLRSHPEIVRQAKKAREQVTSWDRFKHTLESLLHSLGQGAEEIIMALQGALPV